MKTIRHLQGLVLFLALFLSCSKPEVDEGDPPPPSPFTKLYFKFTQNVNGVTLNPTDTILYENLFGNVYSVSNLRYLITDIRLNDWQYHNLQIGQYHLVDASDNSSKIFAIKDSIPAVDYSSISLFLTFPESKNKSGDYPELDEAGMGWSPQRGGGYYSLQMSGRYYSDNADNTADPYNLAIGGNVKIETQSDTSYQHNSIICAMYDSGFKLIPGIKSVTVEIRLNLNKLFENIYGIANYDFDSYPSNIEENSPASLTLSANYASAFSLGKVTYNTIPE